MSEPQTNGTEQPTPRGIGGRGLAQALIAICLVTLFVGAAVPAARKSELQDQGERLIALAEQMRHAARQHHEDTGIYALEISADSAESLHVGASYHRLGMSQSYVGWNGPYIPHPLSRIHNPFGGDIALLSRDSDLRARGFSGGEGVTFGQFLVIDNVPQQVARIVDAEIDQVSKASNWQQSGRVQWLPQAERLLINLAIESD